MKRKEMKGNDNSQQQGNPRSSRCSKCAPSQARKEGEVAQGHREIYELYIDIITTSYNHNVLLRCISSRHQLLEISLRT